VKLEVGAKTDVGLVRDHNEDSFCVNMKNRIFIVADGMGGHAAGEVASNQLKDYIEEYVVQADETDADAIDRHLQEAVQRANRHIHDLGLEDAAKRGMGTTATILIFTEDFYYIAQVGDSRAYLFRNGELTQLTKDHSKVYQLYEHGLITKDEIEDHPYSNIITRSIGTRPTVEADIYRGGVREGDRFLLCSDGLSGEVKDRGIGEVLRDHDTPHECCDELVRQALRNGGRDNVTVLVVDVIARAGSMRQTVPISKKDVERILAAKERQRLEEEHQKKALDEGAATPSPASGATAPEPPAPRPAPTPPAPLPPPRSLDDDGGTPWGFVAAVVLGLLLLVVLVYTVFAGGSTTCAVEIDTMPQGAELYLNGTFLGKSPVTVPLGPGKHKVTAAKDGFVKTTFLIKIAPGDDKPKRKVYPLDQMPTPGAGS